MVLKQFDIGFGAHPVDQGAVHGFTGGVGTVNDAPVAVAALLGQVVTAVAAFPGKVDALINQPANGPLAALNGKPDRVFMAEASAGIECIADMGFDGIVVVQNRCNAALGKPGRALVDGIFTQHMNPSVPGQLQCQCQTGGTGSDNENIAAKVVAHSVCTCPAKGRCPVGPFTSSGALRDHRSAVRMRPGPTVTLEVDGINPYNSKARGQCLRDHWVI